MTVADAIALAGLALRIVEAIHAKGGDKDTPLTAEQHAQVVQAVGDPTANFGSGGQSP